MNIFSDDGLKGSQDGSSFTNARDGDESRNEEIGMDRLEEFLAPLEVGFHDENAE
jgi:hypothetical protein